MNPQVVLGFHTIPETSRRFWSAQPTPHFRVAYSWTVTMARPPFRWEVPVAPSQVPFHRTWRRLW